MSIKRFIFWLWPPYEAKIANKHILAQITKVSDTERWEKAACRVRKDLSECENPKELLAMAKELREAELKRKETIENKATSFVYGVGLAVSIMSAIAVLTGSQLQSHESPTLISIIGYSLAFLFLLVSACYAIKVRRVRAFHYLCADECFDILENSKDNIKDYIVNLITDCKMNETTLTIMTNYLSVAEGLFLRGLALLAFASVVNVLGGLFAISASA